MSWWDRYLAPGDLRAQQRQHAPSTPAPVEEAPPAPVTPQRLDAAHRARRQNAMFFGGIAFTILSAMVTRRALTKKRMAAYPNLVAKSKGINVPTFTPSNPQSTPPKADGGLDAAEALFLATLNVGAIFMAATGAFMKYFDVADTEDLRELVKAGVGYDVYAGDTEADQEIEAWFAEVLSRKDGVGNLRDEIVTKMAELEEVEQKRKVESATKELEELKRKKALLAQDAGGNS